MTNFARAARVATTAAAIAMLASLAGCSTSIGCTKDAVPSYRLDRHFLTESKECYGPVPHTALGQPKPKSHIIGPGDYLSVYVYGIFPPTQDETPILQRFQTLNQRYYPPRGEVQGPSTGLPVEVMADGTIQLPLIGQVPLAGLTVPEAIDRVKTLYIEGEYIEKDRARITLALVTPRVYRITVLREDSPAITPDYPATQQNRERHRGAGQVVDLPVYENDVLHALATTGGLPGDDAPRALWIFRQSAFKTPTAITPAYLDDMCSTVDINNCNGHVTKIPLVWRPGQPLPYGPKDVVLNEGDVVYVPKRDEYFYTGGLLRAAKIPLPRDKDVDILEALAMATGSVGGPLGLDGSALSNGTPGYVLPPSRVLIVRELPDGRNMQIRVDLRKATKDPKHRIYVKENDLISLSCTPGAAFVNTTLNLFNFTIITNSSTLFGSD